MWVWFALVFAILSSISIIIAKEIMKGVEEYTYLLFSSIFTFPFLLLIAIFLFPMTRLDGMFWMVTIAGTGMSAVAGLLAYRAIKQSEISLVSPISAFNPVFTALISFLTLGEKIGLRDIAGILLIVVGAYLLKITSYRKGILTPVRALVYHRGVQLSFIAYFIWAVTPTFEKTAILHTNPKNPPFAALVGQIVAIIIYAVIVVRLSKGVWGKVRKRAKLFLVNGVISGVAIALAFCAFSEGNLGVTTAVFKLSMIFTVIWGWVFFKEKDIKDRLLGSAVMLAGVVLLVI